MVDIEKRKTSVINTLTLIGSVLSIITMIAYGTWFVSTYDKRIAIIEQHSQDMLDRIERYENAVDAENQKQDANLRHFQDKIDYKIDRLGDKIDEISHKRIATCQ